MQPKLPLDATHIPRPLAPCEHIAGNEKFAQKAIGLQEKHLRSNGTSLVDITLDLEDGAPIGQEGTLRHSFIQIILSPQNKLRRIGIRVHSPSSPHFERDLEEVATRASSAVAYITIPKVTSLREVSWAAGLIYHFSSRSGATRSIPLHLLIETPEALDAVNTLAAHPAVESLDFGLMDFISHLGGAIPSTAMKSPAQFDHALIRDVKNEISRAALVHNKTPNHNVTVDVRNPEQAYQDAYRARHEFGFLRMWSIHPDQIEPIIRGMTPSADEVTEAQEILAAAQAANWGPIEHKGRLHDRASFRYYLGILSQSSSV